MSGKGKKPDKKKTNKSLGDVTINDFANATVCKSRSKKSITNVTHAMKQMRVDNRSWDEKVDDFDDDFDLVEEENEDGSKSIVMKTRSASKRRRKTAAEIEIDAREGFEYPIDIWYLISEFISPEDVYRFAGICKSTHSVVCSAKFWFTLYKRFYKSTPSLPERLQPECMMRLYGLKACVIRALHFMYPLFINRTKSVTTFEEHPHNLLKRQCVLMWHSKCKDKWLYYFKLKEHSNIKLHSQQYSTNHQPDLIEMLEDVLANNEENCRILQLSCPHFVPIPLVLGLTLRSVSLTLSQGFRHHRLHLGFGSGVFSGGFPTDGSNCTEIILDPVINARVLDWWHPLYPHGQAMPLLNH